MYDYESNPEAKGVEYQVTKVDPTDPETKGMVYQVHKVSEEIAATLGGKVYRARIINDPTAPTVAGKVYQIVLIGDPSDPAVKGKVYNAILTGGSEVVIVGPAVSPLSLPDAIAGSLQAVKAFGGTEQNGTPTPDAPMDIVSNNGVLRIQGSATGTVAQTGNPTPTTPVDPVFYQNHGLLLRAIGADADTYDASTQTITRNIGYKIFDGTESFGTSSAYGQALYVSGAASAWGADRYKDVLCQYFLGASSPSGAMPEFSCFFNSSRHFYFRTSETATDFKAWLAELYANGTPLIVWFVNSPAETESFTPSVYADGTVETINVHSKNLWNTDPTSYEYFDVTAGGIKRYGHTYRNGTYTVKQNGTGGAAIIYLKIFSNGSYGTAQDITTARTVTVSGDDALLVYSSSGTATDTTDYDIQVERGATATDYQPYFDGGTATAETLLEVGDYQDEQEILSGAVTRNVGVLVLDGTENWLLATATNLVQFYTYDTQGVITNNVSLTSTIAPYGCTAANRTQYDFGCYSGNSGNLCFQMKGSATLTTVSAWTQYLADQYAAGTPVIVIYPLATPTTESVAGQTLQVEDGDNTLEITQASLSGLELEAEYSAVVTLTVQEVEDANLDNNVTVTIQ